MAKRKLTPAQKEELIRLHNEGDYGLASRLAVHYGVSANYACILAARRAEKEKIRPPRKPREMTEEQRRKWARAQLIGPINTRGPE